jgi:hypothetical protein
MAEFIFNQYDVDDYRFEELGAGAVLGTFL